PGATRADLWRGGDVGIVGVGDFCGWDVRDRLEQDRRRAIPRRGRAGGDRDFCANGICARFAGTDGSAVLWRGRNWVVGVSDFVRGVLYAAENWRRGGVGGQIFKFALRGGWARRWG